MFEPQFFTLTSIYVLALLSPGQDFFLIVKHALTHGYKKAWWSCFGIASGNALYIALAYIGHGYISRYPIITFLIEIGSVLFLLYLGLLLLFAPKPSINSALDVKRGIAWKLFFQGLFSALLNPKNILFYFSLLFTIVNPETLLYVKIFYGIWMVGLLVIWNICIAVLFGNKRILIYLPYFHYLQRLIGLGLIGFSLYRAITLLYA